MRSACSTALAQIFKAESCQQPRGSLSSTRVTQLPSDLPWCAPLTTPASPPPHHCLLCACWRHCCQRSATSRAARSTCVPRRRSLTHRARSRKTSTSSCTRSGMVTASTTSNGGVLPALTVCSTRLRAHASSSATCAGSAHCGHLRGSVARRMPVWCTSGRSTRRRSRVCAPSFLIRSVSRRRQT